MITDSDRVLILYQQERNPGKGYTAGRRITVYPQTTAGMADAQEDVLYGFEAKLISVNKDLIEQAGPHETHSWLLDYCQNASKTKGLRLPDNSTRPRISIRTALQNLGVSGV